MLTWSFCQFPAPHPLRLRLSAFSALKTKPHLCGGCASRDHGSRRGEGPSATAIGAARRRPGEQVPRPPTAPCPSPWRGFPRLRRTRKPAVRRDTELHGKFPCRLEINAAGHWSSKFPWDSVSREAGFRVGWRRCNASQRRCRGRMRACTRIRPWPAERGRSPAPPPASVVARSAPPRTESCPSC